MTSHLTQLCERIAATSLEITRTAALLAEQAGQLERAAHDLARLVRDRPEAGRAVQQLDAAASACRRAARTLDEAAQQGQAFVARTVGVTSAPNGWGPSTVHASSATSSGSTRDIETVASLELRTTAGSAYFAADDWRMRAAAEEVPHYPGEYVVDMHGDPSSVACGSHQLDANGLAEVIRASAWDGRTPIRLFSCSTGREPEGIAQQVADCLGVEVTAPDRPVSTGPLGVQVGEVAEVWNPLLGGYVSTVTEPGQWRRFYPRTER